MSYFKHFWCLSTGILLLALAGCNNFDYSHPICVGELRTDVPDLAGPYYQITNSILLLGTPAIEGSQEMAVDSFSIERIGVGHYRITKGGDAGKEITTCKIGNHILVEGGALAQGIQSAKRSILEFNSMPDGFLLTALEVDLDELKASSIPYKTIADKDTLQLDNNGVLSVHEKTPEQKAEDLKNKNTPSKALLVDTSDPKKALQFAKMLVPDSDAKRVYKGTFTRFSERK